MLHGTLQGCNNLGVENYDTLIKKTTQYSAKLLKKSDQCRMVQLCAHLFWSRPVEGDSKEGEEAPTRPSDDKRALECLQVG